MKLVIQKKPTSAVVPVHPMTPVRPQPHLPEKDHDPVLKLALEAYNRISENIEQQVSGPQPGANIPDPAEMKSAADATEVIPSAPASEAPRTSHSLLALLPFA